jgi:hypothetical protein
MKHMHHTIHLLKRIIFSNDPPSQLSLERSIHWQDRWLLVTRLRLLDFTRIIEHQNLGMYVDSFILMTLAGASVLLLIMRGHIYIYTYIYIYFYICLSGRWHHFASCFYTVVGYFSLTVHRRVLTPLRYIPEHRFICKLPFDVNTILCFIDHWGTNWHIFAGTGLVLW